MVKKFFILFNLRGGFMILLPFFWFLYPVYEYGIGGELGFDLI